MLNFIYRFYYFRLGNLSRNLHYIDTQESLCDGMCYTQGAGIFCWR
jgi:hypothetical protein